MLGAFLLLAFLFAAFGPPDGFGFLRIDGAS